MLKFIIAFSALSINIYSQFQDFQSPFTGRLNSGDFSSMNFYSSTYNVLWLCGDSGVVFKISATYANPIGFRYVNNGLSSMLTLKTMCAIDTNTALVAGTMGTNTLVYKTSNSGQNWIQVFSQNGGSINAIWFRSPSTGFMAGNPVGGRWSLWRTTNGGVNWDSTGRYLPQAGGEQGFPNSMRAVGDSIWMGTNNSRIYFSTNYGANWSVHLTGTHQNVYSIYFSWPNQAYAGSDSLLYSNNWGSNWSVVQNTPGTGNILGLVGGNPGVDSYGWPMFYSRGDKIYYNISSWVLFHTASSGTYTYLFKARERSQFGYFGFSAMIGLKTNGGIWICNCAWGGINPLSGEIPESFQMHQNYPNPFNPSTKIKFDLPKSSNVKILIYDAIGNEVSELINSGLIRGSYEVDWDGTRFSSGVYYCRMEAQGFTKTIKILLMK